MSTNINISDLQAALDNKEFELFYQPKVSMITGELTGAEALIRWQKNGEFILPFQFIPLAEESNFIRKITKYVFNELVVDLACIGVINDSIVVSFNASGKDFQDAELAQIINSTIKNNLIQPNKFEIEVTETALVNNSQAQIYLSQMADLGIRIAMDDFGTGHSGLVELSQWPFSTLKMDQKFIKGLKDSDKDREIVKASIQLAHQLDIGVIAEGVEDEETYQVLQELGCESAQGYWISKPMALQDFMTYIKNYKKLSASSAGQLYMSQLDHIQWRKKIIDTALFLHQSSKMKSIENLRGSPEIDHTSCRLGKWYYSLSEDCRDDGCYKKLEEPHIALHKTGDELILAAKNKCSLDELMAIILRLSEDSIRLLSVLQTCEHYLHDKQLKYIMAEANNGESYCDLETIKNRRS
ncbi:MAG: EAL domain-containing protein (putative c-di-GMP-specific phosphodiesterase class I) [Candidatus Azotimanducaceae bacterium]|jgi:EAL domain-containing protein (putative c-di-GMP-specific phosphodiesterase class I)